MSLKRMLTIAIGGAVFIAVVIVIGFLYANSGMTVVHVAAPTASASAQASAPAPGSSGDNLNRVKITVSNVQEVIGTLSRPVSYTRNLSVVSSYSGGSSAYNIHASVLNGVTKLDVTHEQKVKHFIVSGDNVYIWTDPEQTVYKGTIVALGDSLHNSDEFAMLLTYEDVLKLDPSAIQDAGYVPYGGETCIYVKSLSPKLGYTTTYYISIRLGLLIGAETYSGSNQTYKMTSSNYSASAPEAAVFNLPDGTAAILNP